MLTTLGLTASTTEITALEYASRRSSSFTCPGLEVFGWARPYDLSLIRFNAFSCMAFILLSMRYAFDASHGVISIKDMV
jgi:hypothetical protein